MLILFARYQSIFFSSFWRALGGVIVLERIRFCVILLGELLGNLGIRQNPFRTPLGNSSSTSLLLLLSKRSKKWAIGSHLLPNLFSLYSHPQFPLVNWLFGLHWFFIWNDFFTLYQPIRASGRPHFSGCKTTSPFGGQSVEENKLVVLVVSGFATPVF